MVGSVRTAYRLTSQSDGIIAWGNTQSYCRKYWRGGADSNIGFGELCNLLLRLKFDERVRGDHHIFTRADIAEIVNLQPKGNKAKPYQKLLHNVASGWLVAVAGAQAPECTGST